MQQTFGYQISRVCGLVESGIILVKDPNIFQGYLNESDNAGTWVEGGWFTLLVIDSQPTEEGPCIIRIALV